MLGAIPFLCTAAYGISNTEFIKNTGLASIDKQITHNLNLTNTQFIYNNEFANTFTSDIVFGANKVVSGDPCNLLIALKDKSYKYTVRIFEYMENSDIRGLVDSNRINLNMEK